MMTEHPCFPASQPATWPENLFSYERATAGEFALLVQAWLLLDQREIQGLLLMMVASYTTLQGNFWLIIIFVLPCCWSLAANS